MPERAPCHSGHTETLHDLVHRHEAYGHWAPLEDDGDREHVWEIMSNKVLNDGGVLYLVTARAA